MEQQQAGTSVNPQTRQGPAMSSCQLRQRWEGIDASQLQAAFEPCVPQGLKIRQVSILTRSLTSSVRMRMASNLPGHLSVVGCAVRWAERLGAPVFVDLLHGSVSTMTMPRVRRNEPAASYRPVLHGIRGPDVAMVLPLSYAHDVGHAVVTLEAFRRPDWTVWLHTFARLRTALDHMCLERDAEPLPPDSSLFRRLARSAEPVLLSGESAEVRRLALRVHAVSNLSGGMEMATPRGAPTEQLAALCGWVKHTGQESPGHFSTVQRGTLWAVDVHKWCVEAQAVLADTLRRQAFRVIGDRGYRPLRGRVMATISGSLEEALAEGQLLEELWHELAAFVLRPDDLLVTAR